MKKYLVVGNPIEHSLSPQLHNYWIKKYSIDATYYKLKLNGDDLKDLIFKVKKKDINGINITVPFKKKVISYLDRLTTDAEVTQSVNTIYLDKDKITGHNTDISGFESAIKDTNYKPIKKNIFILGAGGVVSSIILALYKMKASSITLSNRTKNKAEYLKNLFNNMEVNQNKIKVVDWGEIPDFDMVINATSVGLKSEDQIDIDFTKFQNNKFFYDVIYNPKETNFLKDARKHNNKTENGKRMFIHQAAASFKIWHDIDPEINEEISDIIIK